LDAPLDRSGRVLVQHDLTVPGHPEVYVIGDLAAFVDQHGATLPGVAPVAIQQGRAAAENVWRTIRGLDRRRFSYRDRGNLATVGRGTGLADLGPLQLSGAAAWIAWLAVHLFWLSGFDNRLLVLFKWAWSYLTHERGARLIIREWRRRAPARTADDGARPPASVQRGTGGSNDGGRDGGLESHGLQPSDAGSGVGSLHLVRGAPEEFRQCPGDGEDTVDGVRSTDDVLPASSSMPRKLDHQAGRYGERGEPFLPGGYGR
jgi:hypothetical protein